MVLWVSLLEMHFARRTLSFTDPGQHVPGKLMFCSILISGFGSILNEVCLSQRLQYQNDILGVGQMMHLHVCFNPYAKKATSASIAQPVLKARTSISAWTCGTPNDPKAYEPKPQALDP